MQRTAPGRFDIIALDADDTLWHNEPLFQATQQRLCDLLARYHDAAWIQERLYETERRNLQHFGYGVKGFVLSMIESAIELTEGRITGGEIQGIVAWGREMLEHPVELMDGVEETVRALATRHRLMLLTKGDLFDQERKLAGSGLGELFGAVEVVSEKDAATYRRVLHRHRVEPERFLMVGNSLRSDILPVVELGAAAVHIPYEVAWAHEEVPPERLVGRDFTTLPSIRALPAWLRTGTAE